MSDWTQMIDTSPEKVRIRVLGWDHEARRAKIATLIRFGERWWYPNYGFYIRWQPVFWKPLPSKKARSA
jgi:hypothetical protein